MAYGRKSISNRLSRYVLLISAGLFVVVTLLLGFLTRRIIERVSEAVAAKDLELAVSEVEKVITEVERAVDNVDWFVERNSSRQSFMTEATRELVSANPNIIGSAVAYEPYYFPRKRWSAVYTYIDAETKELKTIPMGNPDYDYPQLDWYRVPRLHDKPMWSEPYFDEGAGSQRMATYSKPLRDTTGRFFGMITSDISLEWLAGRIRDIAPDGTSYAVLVSANGTYIAHPDSTKVLSQTVFDVTAAMGDSTALAMARDMVGGKRGSGRFNGGSSDDSYAAYGPLSNGWSVLLVRSYASAFIYLYRFNLLLGLFIVLGLIGMYLGCRRVIRRQTMPLVDFSQAAMTIAKGNFKATIPPVKSKDELLTLHDSLVYMQKSINEYIAELKTTTASNERYESELNIARGIQMGMLPRNFPQLDQCSLNAMVQPAKEVGGDLYDFLVAGDALYFMVGDVSGKGVPAALFMAIARAAFRFIGPLGLSMAEVMSRVNNCLCDGNKNEMFVTIFAGRLDLKTGLMTYCNAGHNPILVVPAGGEAYFLHARPNLAAGLFPDFPYQGEELLLAPGTRLVLYTDGVTEAEQSDHSQFGEARLKEWAAGLNPAVSSGSATIDLYSRVKNFTRGADQNDDITIMTILFDKK